MHAFSNHTYVVATRWIGLALTALLLFVQQRPLDWWSLWLVLLLATVVLMMTVQPVMRLAVRQPWILGVDVTLAALAIVSTDPWNSPFFLYACAVLALPALVSGWRGGVLAGLLCSGLIFLLTHLLDVSFGTTLTHIWLRWGLVAVGPALVGAALPQLLPLMRNSWHTYVTNTSTASVSSHLLTTRWRESVDAGIEWFSTRTNRTLDGGVVVAERVEPLRMALYAPYQSDRSLPEMVELHAAIFEQQTLIATRVVVLGRPQTHDVTYTPLIRRVLIEALLNVMQHANANAVVIMLRYDKHTVTMLIHDDGVGLPVTGIHRAGLHSLHALMYRVSELGGRLEVFNHTPAGVAVRMIMPLQA